VRQKEKRKLNPLTTSGQRDHSESPDGTHIFTRKMNPNGKELEKKENVLIERGLHNSKSDRKFQVGKRG